MIKPPEWILRGFAAVEGWRTRRALARPQATQAALLGRILARYADTEVGRSLGLAAEVAPAAFARRVPVTDEAYYRPFIAKVLETNAPGVVDAEPLRFMAWTSGTTSASKHIPYPLPLIRAFKRFETKLMLHTMREGGRYDFLQGQLLITAGNPTNRTTPQGLTLGQSSGIMTLLAPAFAQQLVRPTRPVLEIPDWERKIEATVREALPLDVRVMTGIPLFVIPILERLLAHAAEQGRPAPHAQALWPNLRAYYWAGAPIGVYEARLRELFGPGVRFREVYSATEAPIAYQDRDGEPGLLLDVENCYFEFLPLEAPLDAPRLGVHEVEAGRPYRLFVTTLGGLFAYRLGDRVEFVETAPPKIRVLGREAEEMSLFSEKLQLAPLRALLTETAAEQGLEVVTFFLCPTSPRPGVPLGYDWHVEFVEPPADAAAFVRALDERLCAGHPYYGSPRRGDSLIGPPELTVLPPGVLERHVLDHRQFGQGKLLHLYSSREAARELLAAVGAPVG